MKRLNLRREDGVAMTEFALILPIFMVIVAGMLAFGRVVLLLDRREPRRERDSALGGRGSQPVRADHAAGARCDGAFDESSCRTTQGLHRLPDGHLP